MKAARSRLLLVAVLALVVGGTIFYVVQTTDRPATIAVGSAAADAFRKDGTLDPRIERALFSPDGLRLGVFGDGVVGLGRNGNLQNLSGTATIGDFAWMPTAKALLVGEGPEVTNELDVLDFNGNVIGIAHLDAPFSLGEGSGMTVDRRGARAVAVSETRDAIGGRRHLDLVLVHLANGHVEPLTTTADADESRPLFVDDNRIVFARRASARITLVELNLTTRAERVLVSGPQSATPVSVLTTGAIVYADARSGERVAIRALTRSGRSLVMGRLPSGSTVWTTDPAGTRAVATVVITLPDGEKQTKLRAVTLKPPQPG